MSASEQKTTRAVHVLGHSVDADVVVPGSKSHTNRAFVCAALASGKSTLSGVLFANDTEAMMDSLGRLDVGLTIDRDGATVIVDGTAGRLPAQASVDVRQSGTTGRFLLPMLALGQGTYVLDGDEQLRARPFGDLIASLSALGAKIEGVSLPLTVDGCGLKGGQIEVPGSVSSQFLSGLLLSAPLAESEVVIQVEGDLVSVPYVELTIRTMESFGAEVSEEATPAGRRYVIAANGYRSADVLIEPDASAASYFFAAAAVTGGRVRVEGLGTTTVQGDLAFVDVLEEMGATVHRGENFTEVIGPDRLRGIDVDMADISDTAQSLAAIAPFADGPTTVTGIGFIRKKETDRIDAVVTELRRLGIDAVEQPDGFMINPAPQGWVDAVATEPVATYDDHQMAMSFAVLGLVKAGVQISDPSCVNKTFPSYFEVLDSLRQSAD